MKNPLLPNKISRTIFDRYLASLPTEDLGTVNAIDDLLEKKRGYVFQIPSPGEAAILLTSGGIDSTTAWAALMGIYHIKVFPLIILKSGNHSHKELNALKKISTNFKQTYPDFFVEPFTYTAHPMPKELATFNSPQYIHPQTILDNYNAMQQYVLDGSNIQIQTPTGTFPYLMPFYGAMYSRQLYRLKRITIKNIIVATNATDRIAVTGQSFTALRGSLLNLCASSNDYSWNYGSFFLEREIGHLLSKTEVIKLGNKLKVPFEHTWTCYKSKPFQCGDGCITCLDRRSSFENAGVKDNTLYWSDLRFALYRKFRLFIKSQKIFKLAKRVKNQYFRY